MLYDFILFILDAQRVCMRYLYVRPSLNINALLIQHLKLLFNLKIMSASLDLKYLYIFYSNQ